MPGQPTPPRRALRSEPREVAELRLLKSNQPELGEAVDFQIELLSLQRRVQGRVPLPMFEFEPAWLKLQHEQGLPILRFEEIPLDWTELRLMFRQTADILVRYRAIEPADHAQLQALARTGNTLEPLVARWYKSVLERASATRDGGAGDGPGRETSPAAADNPPATAAAAEAFEHVLTLAMRPFLERCAESIQQRLDLTAWAEPYCPVCGGEVEFAVITPAAERLLICSRCTGRWRFDPITCPFCRNGDRTRITSFTSRDGQYRLYACDVCQRYLKAYDGRSAARPLMLAVDTIATLPLDAAAMKKGYRA